MNIIYNTVHDTGSRDNVMNGNVVGKERLVQLHKELVSIPSISGQEHEASDWVENVFKEIGVPEIVRLPVAESADTVVAVINGNSDQHSNGLMMCFHIDIWEPGEEWTRDPFTPIMKDGRIYGAGAHDMKGGAVSIIGALESLLAEDKQLHGTLVIAATTDEMRWSRGIYSLIESGLIDNCKYAIVGEWTPPGEFHIGANGRHIVRIRALEGVDPGIIDDLCNVFSVQILSEVFTRKIKLRREKDEFVIDAHLPPGKNLRDLRRVIDEVLVKHGIESSDLGFVFDPRPTPAPLPYQFDDDCMLVTSLKRAIREETGLQPYGSIAVSVSDANHLVQNTGLETLIYGPCGGGTDTPDEYVEIDSLYTTAKIHLRLMHEYLCNNP